MKEYPLTAGELRELGAVGVLATLCFSIGSATLNFAINVSQNFAFSSNVPKEISVYWDTLRIEAFIATGVLYLFGLISIAYTGFRVRRIQKETEHDE